MKISSVFSLQNLEDFLGNASQPEGLLRNVSLTQAQQQQQQLNETAFGASAFPNVSAADYENQVRGELGSKGLLINLGLALPVYKTMYYCQTLNTSHCILHRRSHLKLWVYIDIMYVWSHFSMAYILCQLKLLRRFFFIFTICS